MSPVIRLLLIAVYLLCMAGAILAIGQWAMA